MQSEKKGKPINKKDFGTRKLNYKLLRKGSTVDTTLFVTKVHLLCNMYNRKWSKWCATITVSLIPVLLT